MSIAASAVLSSLPLSGFGKPESGQAQPGKSRKPGASSPPRHEPAAKAPSRKWPFPPAPQPAASLGDARKLAPNQIVSRREMLLDVLLVAAWGAIIPALMWLGAAAGF
ncbi:MAG TPA: hypothetical protein VGC69_15965 [Bordetella sp.]